MKSIYNRKRERKLSPVISYAKFALYVLLAKRCNAKTMNDKMVYNLSN